MNRYYCKQLLIIIIEKYNSDYIRVERIVYNKTYNTKDYRIQNVKNLGGDTHVCAIGV